MPSRSFVMELVAACLLPLLFPLAAAPGGDTPSLMPTIRRLTLTPTQHTPFIGGSATLTTAFTGTPPLSFQWLLRGSPIPDATNSVLRLNNLRLDQSGPYQFKVENSSGVAISQPVSLKVSEWVIWGNNIIQNRGLPDSATNLVAISSWEAHTIGLRGDGTVVVWGHGEDYAELAPPPGLRDVVAVSAGPGYNLALKSDGRITGWGWNFPALKIQTGNSNIVAIAAGHQYCLAIRSDGKLLVFGDNPEARSDAFGISDATRITAFLSGGTVTRSQGSVQQIGVPADVSMPAPPIPAEARNVAARSGELYGFGLALLDDGPPRMVQQPRSLTGISGGNARLVASAFGKPPLRYQWRFNGTPLRGATDSVLALDRLTFLDQGRYDVVVSNERGVIQSQPAEIAVSQTNSAPGEVEIQTLPANGVALMGGSARLTARVAGSQALDFQWFHNGRLLPGARGAILELTQITAAEAGLYEVQAGNGFGVGPRASTNLTVVPIFAWGNDDARQLEVPASATNAISVFAGSNHGVALTSEGRIVVWGNQPRDGGFLPGGNLAPPPGLSNVVHVASGNGFSVALLADGTVRGWGNNDYGQLRQLAGWSNVVALAAGYSYTLGLRADGSLLMAGAGFDGALRYPKEFEDYVAIAGSHGGGPEFSAALRSNGILVPASETFPADATGPGEIVALSGRFGIRANGEVVDWTGQIVTIHTNLATAASGWRENLGLLESGRIVGLTGSGVDPQAERLESVIQIATGLTHSYALLGSGPPRLLQQPIDCTLGLGKNLRLGVSASGALPMRYQWRHQGQPIPGANRAMLVLDDLSTFDAGAYDVLVSNAHGSSTSRVATVTLIPELPSTPRILSEPSFGNALLGGTARLSVAAKGTPPLVYYWRFQDQFLFGNRGPVLELAPLTFDDSGVYTVSAANALGAGPETSFRLSVLNVTGWGPASSATDRALLSLPSHLTNVVNFSVGRTRGFALRPDGSLQTWGDQSLATPAVPEAPPTVTEFRSLLLLPPPRGILEYAVADSYVLSLRTNGTVAQIVDPGTSTLQPPPAGLDRVVHVAAGPGHALALRRDGSIVGWGQNESGQLIPPPGLSEVIQLAAGGGFSLALKEDGSVTVWGKAPRILPDRSDFVFICAGDSHWAGLRSDGSVFSTGYPVPDNLPPVTAITAAGDATFARVPVSSGPVFARQPISKSVPSGRTLRLVSSVFATSGTVSFQWFRNDQPLSGETGPVLELSDARALHAGTYWVRGSNPAGSVLSRKVQVEVIDQAPAIVREPVSVRTTANTRVGLSVEASGSEPLVYRWYFQNLPIPGASSPTFTLDPSTHPIQAGSYFVVVRNEFGTATSRAVSVKVLPEIRLGGESMLLPDAGQAVRLPITPRGTLAVPVVFSEPPGSDQRIRLTLGEGHTVSQNLFFVAKAGVKEQKAVFELPALGQQVASGTSIFLQLMESEAALPGTPFRGLLVPADNIPGAGGGSGSNDPARFETQSVKVREDGMVELSFSIPPGTRFVVETSEDLIRWQEIDRTTGIASLDPGGSSVWFLHRDPIPGVSRFYRVVYR